MPRPWLAEIGKTSGNPSPNASAAASPWPKSTLLAATTGRPDWRSTLATSASTR